MLTVNFETLAVTPRDRVLDLGCGRGRHVHGLAARKNIRAVGLDLSFEDVLATRTGIVPPGHAQPFDLCVGDVRRLPFGDGAFDVVICAEVLEHIRDYRVALGEIGRVLKPGGRLAVSVPRYWPEWLCWRLNAGYHNAPGGHVRIFRARALTRDIEARGLRHRRTHWAHSLHAPYWWLQCLVWERRETSPLVRLYHRFLVWDIMKRPLVTRLLARLLDPLMGKSVVLYFAKEPTPV